MNINERERTLISKPVASRPTISDFRPFSDPTAGTTNGSHSPELTLTAIRPKTVRLESVLSSKPPHMVSSQVELTRTQSFHLSDKNLKPNHTSQLLYKPLAKTVSRTAISLLANMKTFNGSHEQALARNLGSLSKKSGNDNIDESSYDGYNWRKYGQKQVKGSEYPRSYYKCTHANCVVKKKVERSIDGRIVEIVYKDDHNHSKPRVPRRHAFDGTSEDVNQQVINSRVGYDDEDVGSSSRLTNLVKVKESKHHGSSEGFDASILAPRVKKRRNMSQLNEGIQEPRVIVHDGTDSEATSDGYRWRKYGQKVVKGNPYPRSYYRCTGVKCDVRKHVERTSDDPSVFITTYEGKHNHEMPIKKTS